jgi:branched-chain amino acid transport system substrate-binding protein
MSRVYGQLVSRREFIKAGLSLLAVSAAACAPAGAPGAPTGPRVTEIKIGSIHPLTGAGAFEGNLVARGVRLRIEEANAAGGIKSLGGAKINLIEADTQGKPEVGQSETERLIREGCVALMGAFHSAVTIVTTQVAEREGVPFVISVAVSDRILQRGFKYSFRQQPNATMMGRLTVRALKELVDAAGGQYRRVAFIHEDTEMGQTISAAAFSALRDAGFELVEDITYNAARVTDVTAEASRVRAANPDIILMNGYYPDTLLWVRTFRDLRVSPKAIVGVANSLLSNPNFVKEEPKLAEYMIDGNYWWNPNSDRARRVKEAYEKRYNEPFTNHSAQGYQSADVLIDALERAGSTDRDRIREALAKTKLTDIIVPGDTIEFDETGQNKNAQPLLLQILKGVVTPVAPQKYAAARAVFPIPALDERLR